MSAERIEFIRTRAHTWVEEGIIPTLVLLAARRP
jgi:hypothetical protein